MSVEWDDILARLSARFPDADIKHKPGPGGTSLAYIDARDVEDRLDEVVGPAFWHDDYQPFGDPAHHAVLCHLTVHGVTKSGVGYPNGTNDAEPYKSAESDSVKRAAVKFGLGRFLYDEKPQRGGQRRAAEPTEQPTRASNYTPTGVHNPRPSRQTTENDSPKPAQHTGGRPALDSQLKAIRDLSRQAGTPEDPQPGDYNFQLAGARIQELQSATRQGGQQ